MSKGYGHFNLKLGDHATASNNFFLEAPSDTAPGTIRLVQGIPGTETRTVLSVNSSGDVTLPQKLTVAGTLGVTGKLTNTQVAKAWVSFDASGTILAGYNVSSVTHLGTGSWRVNFTTAFSSANYCVVCSGNVITSNIGPVTRLSTINASYIEIIHYENNAAVDSTLNCVVCYGEQ